MQYRAPQDRGRLGRPPQNSSGALCCGSSVIRMVASCRATGNLYPAATRVQTHIMDSDNEELQITRNHEKTAFLQKPLSHNFPAKHRPSRSVYYSSPSPSRRLAKPTSHNRPTNGKHEERWHVRTMAKLKHAECVSIVIGSFNFIGLALSTGMASRLRSCSMPRHAM